MFLSWVCNNFHVLNMKKPILTYWNDTGNLKSLLLFAQLLDEMLYHQTIDSYKAPVLIHILFVMNL